MRFLDRTFGAHQEILHIRHDTASLALLRIQGVPD